MTPDDAAAGDADAQHRRVRIACLRQRRREFAAVLQGVRHAGPTALGSVPAPDESTMQADEPVGELADADVHPDRGQPLPIELDRHASAASPVTDDGVELSDDPGIEQACGDPGDRAGAERQGASQISGVGWSE